MGCTSSSKKKEKSKQGSPNHSSDSSSEYRMAGQNFLSSFPAANSQQRLSQSSGRKKVALKPGRSLMDWIRLGRSGQDLTGVGGKRIEVSEEELAKHNKPDDCWIALRGRVYNVTHYMEYHPGGEEELMRGVGKDGTQLFDEVHKWVNYDSMLEKCFVGTLKAATPVHKRDSLSKLPGPGVINGPSLAALKPPSGPQAPRFDWFQSSENVTVTVYTKWKNMKHEFVIIDLKQRHFLATLHIEDYVYNIHIDLEDDVLLNYEVKVHADTGKTDIILKKEKTDKQWKSIGKHLENHNRFVKLKDLDIVYRRCTVDSVSEVNHDSKLLCISLPPGTRMCPPIGYHVHIKHDVSGVELVRSYTVVLPSLSPEEQDNRVQEGKVFYLMIKIYKDGALTPWINSLCKGDSLDISGYDGNFVDSRLNESTCLVMFAAGTGLTPMLRLMYQSLHRNTTSNRVLKLMFFNKTERDILWRKQLDTLADKFNKVSVDYVLSEADDTWDGKRGRISKELIQELMPELNEDVKLLMCACGPSPFTNSVIQLSKELGYKDENIHAFMG